MKKLLIPTLLIGVLSGCYTQLLTEQPLPTTPAVQKISYIIDSVTNDTIKVLHQIDTLIARDQQNCYWTRNMWGQPELRCDGGYYSNYSSSWNMYNNSPWWYERDMYGNYYNSYYGFGNYYNGNHYNPYNYYGNNGNGGSSSVAPSGKRTLRRTSSSAMSRYPEINNTSIPQSKNMRTESPPPPQPVVQNPAPAAPAPENRPANTNDNNNRRKPGRSW